MCWLYLKGFGVGQCATNWRIRESLIMESGHASAPNWLIVFFFFSSRDSSLLLIITSKTSINSKNGIHIYIYRDVKSRELSFCFTFKVACHAVH